MQTGNVYQGGVTDCFGSEPGANCFEQICRYCISLETGYDECENSSDFSIIILVNSHAFYFTLRHVCQDNQISNRRSDPLLGHGE